MGDIGNGKNNEGMMGAWEDGNNNIKKTSRI
jgi:hypothetical protein